MPLDKMYCYVYCRPSRYVPLFGFRKYDPEKESVWQPEVSFEKQVSAMGELIKEGKIKHWGVSNETTYGEDRTAGSNQIADPLTTNMRPYKKSCFDC
jgi:aryl-alcohol dehydrogenase-like predicted oxidoreductase